SLSTKEKAPAPYGAGVSVSDADVFRHRPGGKLGMGPVVGDEEASMLASAFQAEVIVVRQVLAVALPLIDMHAIAGEVGIWDLASPSGKRISRTTACSLPLGDGGGSPSFRKSSRVKPQSRHAFQ